MSDQANAYMGFGWCPLVMPDPVGNFDIEKYMGTWYEIRRDKEVWYGKGSECVTATYSYKPEWWRIWKVDVNNRSYDRDKDEVRDTTWGWGTDWTRSWARCDDQGNCDVKFYWYPEGNYQVLDTDYTTYSLVYGCDTWFGLFYTNQ